MKRMQTSLLLLFLSVQSYAAAIDQLIIPQGMRMPALPKRAKLPAAAPAVKKNMRFDDDILPPRSMIERKTANVNVLSLKIQAKPKLNDTTHVAVLLKKKGYRLFKKRSLANQNWMYWIKSHDGTPLYKVELQWLDKQRHMADFTLWSWDDKSQLNLHERHDLVQLFGRIV